MRIRLITALDLSANVAIAILICADAPPAAAVPTGALGWCTTVGPGQKECGFGSSVQACERQHEVFAPSQPFYGAEPFGTAWYNNHCRWKTGGGIIAPTTVQFECVGAVKPTAPWNCQAPPMDDCQNKGATPLGATPNSIDLVSGAKGFRAIDYRTADGALSLARSYTTLLAAGSPSKLAAVPLGLANWRFWFQVELHLSIDWVSLNVVTVVLPGGSGFSFQRQTDGSIEPYTSSTYPLKQTDYTLTFDDPWPPNPDTITDAKTHWTLRDPYDGVWSLETFADVSTGLFTVARPVRVTRRGGLQLDFQYGTSNQLISITDSFGKTIGFEWNLIDPQAVGGTGAVLPGAISQANLPGGNKIRYSYQTIGKNTTGLPQPDRLSKVESLDASGVVLDSTTYRYDDPNLPDAITRILDKNKVLRWKVTYDAAGRATVSEGPRGAHRATVTYPEEDGETFTRTLTNALGRSQIYNYERPSARGYAVKLTSIAGQATSHCPATTGSFAYTDDLLSSRTDEEGRVTTYERDAKARVTRMVEASGTAVARTTSIAWHPDFNLPTQIVRPGLATEYVYDTQGRLTSRTETDTTTHTEPYSTNGQTRTWTYTRSSTGQLLTIDGPLAGITDQTTYTYVPNGYLATITNGLGQRITVDTVNSRGQPTQVTDANGIPIVFVYDPLGHLMSASVNPGGQQAVTSFLYNVRGEITRVTLSNVVVLTFAYNNAGRLMSITNDANEEIKYTYDKAGDITGIDAKNSGGTTVLQVRRTYDELSRILKNIGAANQETQFAYDRVDNLIHITDPRSNTYGNEFDELNRLVRETYPDLHETNVTFTDRDDVASVTDARSNETVFVRNGWGDIIRETSPDRGVTVYVRDERGLMIQRTDARGQVTIFEYDGLGRPTSRSFPGAPSETVTWSYDSTDGGNKGVGWLTGFTDASGTVAYTYDALGHRTRVVRVMGARTYETHYKYDEAGNVMEITLPSGRIVTNTRDNLAHVTSVTTKDDASASSNTVVSSVAWRPFGPLASLTLGNGIDLQLAYDNDGRLTDIDAAGGGITVQDLSYAYDPASNIIAIDDNLITSRSQIFDYDHLNRLNSATGAYGNKTYDYDEVGNRTEQTVTLPSAGAETYTTASASNRLDSISGAVNRDFTYAATGEVLTDQRSPVDSWTYTIKKDGRMSAATLNGVPQATFAYDADGLRIVKTNALTSAVTHYIYNLDGQLLAEMDDVTGEPIREYIWLGALLIGYVDRLGAGGDSGLFFMHADHLGRPQKFTDPSGTIVWDGVFDPFGEIHSITGTIDNFLRFPGQIDDSETGLTQNWHRDYDPTIGRYLQSDLIGLKGGINTYAYVRGNPVKRIDPTGMSDGEESYDLWRDLTSPTRLSAWHDFWRDFWLGGQPYVTDPYGTLSVGGGGSVGVGVGISLSFGIYHDVSCATCRYDWAQHWGFYGTGGFRGLGPFPEKGFYIGGGPSVEFGYSRDESFRGWSNSGGLEFKAGEWGGAAVISIDPNATPLAGTPPICRVSGWQVSGGPGGAFGVFAQKSKTGVYELVGSW
jgi:RHS repeat-associated protein